MQARCIIMLPSGRIVVRKAPQHPQSRLRQSALLVIALRGAEEALIPTISAKSLTNINAYADTMSASSYGISRLLRCSRIVCPIRGHGHRPSSRLLQILVIIHLGSRGRYSRRTCSGRRRGRGRREDDWLRGDFPLGFARRSLNKVPFSLDTFPLREPVCIANC